jgi:hypothetical protein
MRQLTLGVQMYTLDPIRPRGRIREHSMLLPSEADGAGTHPDRRNRLDLFIRSPKPQEAEKP